MNIYEIIMLVMIGGWAAVMITMYWFALRNEDRERRELGLAARDD